jgi:hypothetical protein
VSQQGDPGWFPECLICGMGNLPGVVCLSPPEEDHGLTPLGRDSPTVSVETERDGHVWKLCLLCDTVTLADPFAWGSRAYCVECWNAFVGRGLFPPRSAVAARRLHAGQWPTSLA